MKLTVPIFVVMLLFTGCDFQQREQEIRLKSEQLNERERIIIQKEQALDIREQQLTGREQRLDSTFRRISYDSLMANHADLLGVWTTKMQCTETSCRGSAVGDTKNELWEFKFQDQFVVVTATANNQIERIYTGTFDGDLLNLNVTLDSTDKTSAQIVARLKPNNKGEMQGEREIRQTNGCRILYSLQLKKQ